ncbi:hypothetical protein M9H77_12489 [Catharanthus roseus]|uniref:Uncharacterized protein n=1 Tax=Catharanthus roseus TaxID=4058 RepID=A0ACC0BHH9_CATRO|nr:hypothetical protein M9H77_12489 [Catharanthus roseus]
MAGDQPIRPRRSLTLAHEDHALSFLARTRYFSPGSSTTMTSSATPVTPVIRLVISLYFLQNTLSLLVENLGTQALSVDAYPVHHFIDELSSITILQSLPVESSINQSMEYIDEGIEEGFEWEHNAEGKGSFGSDLQVVGMTPGGMLFSPANIRHYLSCPHFSNIQGIGLEKEANFDEVTKVLTGDTGAVSPETNRLNLNLMKMLYRALFRVF